MSKNDGGSADYYQLPDGAAELQDLIEHKSMNFAVGNIFKAAYRLGAENSLSDRSRDLRKIMWFAERELQRLAGQEDAVEAARGALANDAAHKAPSGQPPLYTAPDCANYEIEQCVDCFHCANFVRGEWAEKDQCRRCHNGGCAQRGLARQTTDCIQFVGHTAMNLSSHPLHPVFLLVAEEYDRSVAIHKPWEGQCYPVQVMLAVVKAELAEVELAVAMGEEEEVLTELAHTANVCCKSIAELTRRKNI